MPSPSLRRFLRLPAPPAFPDAQVTGRARVLDQVAWATALLVIVAMPILIVVQPDTIWRAIRVLVIGNAAAGITLVLNHRGRTRLASWLYVSLIIAMLTYNAVESGGIHSPGVQAYFIFVMLAGLLLGRRAGVTTALACATIGLGLVLGDLAGLIGPPKLLYGPMALWIITCVYIGVSLIVMRLANEQVGSALDRVRAELAVRVATEARLERALDAGRIGIFEHDLRTGQVLCDDRALALTELVPGPDGRVASEAWTERVHPDDRERVVNDFDLIARGKPQGHTHYRLVVPTGGIRYVEASASLTLDAAGHPASVLGMVRDVTERRHAEAERDRVTGMLRERVKELRLLHEVGRLLQESSAVDRLLLDDLVALMPGAWLHAADACARITYRDVTAATPGWRDTPWKQTATFNTSEGPGTLEVGYLREHASAQEGPFLAEERALIDSLAEMLRSHIEHRVTDRHRQALASQLRQAQKMDALGTLAGGIAHDFNNILTAIGGNAQLAAAEARAGTPVADALGEILTAHERARDLVRRILLFSRREETTRRVIALGSLVEETLRLLRVSLPPNTTIASDVPKDLPQTLADASQLHQVFMNLGTNAAYAMKERGGTLTVRLDTVTFSESDIESSVDVPPGQYVRIVVADTGSGMSREVQERLFEPFFTTKGQAGTGLGLSVVHGIVRDHGGAITLSSEVGVGTQFEVYLPVYRGAAEGADEAAERMPRGAGQHIMYVDDEPSLAHVMARTFIFLGYRCTSFADANAALHEFRVAPHNFDAVVTDLQMPAMSGLEFIRSVREIRADTPAAVASGYGAEKALDQDVGPIEWVHKPCSLQEIAVVAERLVGRATPRTAPKYS